MGAVVALAWFLAAQPPQTAPANIEKGTLPAAWPSAPAEKSACAGQPDWHIHEYNPDFYILRESGCVHYEKPFLYLIFGEEKAALIDTGAGKTPLAPTIDGIIAKWLQRRGRTSIALTVTHSHPHGDHVAHDSEFRNKPNTQLIPANFAAIQQAFALQSNATGTLELGNRTIDVIPIPGHHEASLAFYDRRTAILLTGDSLYAGRLYITDWPAFAASTKRLVDFTATRPVAHILGCHIEQTRTPFTDYPTGTTSQPDEHSLELSRAHLLELDAALTELGATPKRHALRDMTLYPREPMRKKRPPAAERP